MVGSQDPFEDRDELVLELGFREAWLVGLNLGRHVLRGELAGYSTVRGRGNEPKRYSQAKPIRDTATFIQTNMISYTL